MAVDGYDLEAQREDAGRVQIDTGAIDGGAVEQTGTEHALERRNAFEEVVGTGTVASQLVEEEKTVSISN